GQLDERDIDHGVGDHTLGGDADIGTVVLLAHAERVSWLDRAMGSGEHPALSDERSRAHAQATDGRDLLGRERHHGRLDRTAVYLARVALLRQQLLVWRLELAAVLVGALKIQRVTARGQD